MAIAETAARKLLHDGGGVAAFSFGLDGLWQMISGFFADIFAGAAHLLALPFEALWQWIVAAANAICSGLSGLWHLVAGFLPNLFAALAGAAHQLVLPLEALWHWLVAAAGAIGSGLGDLWHDVVGFLPRTIASAAHDLAPKVEAFWRWAQSAAAVALPYLLAAAAVLLVVALVWFFGPAICRALVLAACYLAHGLHYVGAAVAGAASFLLPPCTRCLQCCGRVTMKAPGAAGLLISRAAFAADTTNYFRILHSAGGAVVATAVFCVRPVAWALAAPVASLFRASVGAS